MLLVLEVITQRSIKNTQLLRQHTQYGMLKRVLKKYLQSWRKNRMKILVTHYADVSPYEAIQAMKKELHEKYRCGGMYDDVIFKDGVLYGLRYSEKDTLLEASPLNISQET